MIEYVIAATLLFSTAEGRLLERPIRGTYSDVTSCAAAWNQAIRRQPAGLTFIRASGTLCAKSENLASGGPPGVAVPFGAQQPANAKLAEDYRWLAEMKRKQALLAEGPEEKAALKEALTFDNMARTVGR